MTKVIKMERHFDEFLATVVVTSESGMWWKKVEYRTERLVGGSIVWHYLPDFRRASSFLEGKLCSAWLKFNYEEQLQKERSK
jgi:hypothetical protein